MSSLLYGTYHVSDCFTVCAWRTKQIAALFFLNSIRIGPQKILLTDICYIQTHLRIDENEEANKSCQWNSGLIKGFSISLLAITAMWFNSHK